MKRLKEDINYASIKNISTLWSLGGINAVKTFLNDKNTNVYKNTWVEKIKNLINDGKQESASYEIELILFNINLNENLNND